MAGIYSQNTVTEVQQANDIVDLVSEHVNLVAKGREMVGLCPFHEDHRPSMYVNSEKQIFKCFACGAGGDVFKFVQMRENLSFPQAIERLAERASIKLKPSGFSGSKSHSSEVDPNSIAKLNDLAAAHFRKNLFDEQKGKTTRDYLVERKISSQSIDKWRLGLAAKSQNDLLTAAKTAGFSGKLPAQAGLVAGTGMDKFVNRLMFPILDVTGRVIGFGGRTMQKDPAKYINSPKTVLFDKSNCLYGMQPGRERIVSSGTAVVVEGYTDCIMAHQFGIENVVASLGTSFTQGQARLLKRYARQIILVFDSDAAGREAANRALEICLVQHMDIKIASVPQGKDPCDFLLICGKNSFEKMLEQSVDVFEFKWKRLTEKFDSDGTLAGRKSAIGEFLRTIAVAIHNGVLPVIEKGLIVNRLSRIIGADSREINSELNRELGKVQRTSGYVYATKMKNQKVSKVDLGEGSFALAQREILEVLLDRPELFKSVKQKISAEDFDQKVLKQIFVLILETVKNSNCVSPAEILSRTESPSIAGVITQLVQAGEKKGNFTARLEGAIEAIDRHKNQAEKNRIRQIKNKTEFLKNFYENTRKQNPHNVGMR